MVLYVKPQIILLKKSFTLIELLIVVAIIGILAGVGVPMYNNYIQNAKIATVQSNFDEFVKFMQVQMVNCETSNTIQLNKGNGLQAVQCPNDAWEMAWSLTSHFQNEGWMTAYPQEWYAKWSPYAVHVSNDPGGKKLCRTDSAGYICIDRIGGVNRKITIWSVTTNDQSVPGRILRRNISW